MAENKLFEFSKFEYAPDKGSFAPLPGVWVPSPAGALYSCIRCESTLEVIITHQRIPMCLCAVSRYDEPVVKYDDMEQAEIKKLKTIIAAASSREAIEYLFEVFDDDESGDLDAKEFR